MTAIIDLCMQGAHTSVGVRFDCCYGSENYRGYGYVRGPYSGYNLPPGNITLYAEDIHGASSAQRISVVLCACANGGTCVTVYTNETIEFNKHGHFKEVCLCPEHYGGESCEIDMRGCSNNTCPNYSVCVNDNRQASGYHCSGCAVGYMYHNNKCIGNCFLYLSIIIMPIYIVASTSII